MPPNVWGQRGNMMAKIHYKSILEVEWWRIRWKNEPSNQYSKIIKLCIWLPIHCSSPRYIRVQWPWMGMIYKICHMWSSPRTIYNRSESPWWRYTKDQDLHGRWRYTMDQDLHNGWIHLTYTGIKSREPKYHDHWHNQGGSIYEIPLIWKVFYIIHYEHISYYVNRGVEVEHSSPSSDYQSLMYTVNRHEITHR